MDKAIELLNEKLTGRVDRGHGIDHALKVMEHVDCALIHETLSKKKKLILRLAALLHDADDRKFFPENHNYENARYVLDNINLSSKDKEKVIKVIDLVSYSKNKNKKVSDKNKWMLLPRYADRLEAMGRIGIFRCYMYTLHINRPIFLEETPRFSSYEEIEEYLDYKRDMDYDGRSRSMMDHFYDKVLFLHEMDTDNQYFIKEKEERHKFLMDFCIRFGEQGFVDVSKITSWS